MKGDIWIACNYRFHPAVKVLKENLSKVGEVLYCRMHFSHYLPNQRENWQEYMKGTNIVLDVGWHFIDLALWLFSKVDDWQRLSSCQELTFDDFATIELLHRKVNTQIFLDYLRRDKSWGIEVVGKKGTLKLDASQKNPEICFVTFDNEKNGDILYKGYVASDEPFENQTEFLLKNWQSNIKEAMEVAKICQS